MLTVSNYKAHCENLQMIERAITIVQRTVRDYTRKDEEDNIYVYTKVLSHLISTWTEVRILKIINEQNAYTDAEKTRLLVPFVSAKDRWQTALMIAASKAYHIPENDLLSVRLDITPRSRLKMLLNLIDQDLLSCNQMRNKVAHGQWKYPFNEELNKIDEKLIPQLYKENIGALQLQYALLDSLAQIIHDLAVSKLTFERDYDKNYRRIENQKITFEKFQYKNYKRMMIANRRNYLEKKLKRHLFELDEEMWQEITKFGAMTGNKINNELIGDLIRKGLKG